MLFHFATAVIFLAGAAAFVLLILVIGSFLRPKLPNPEKLSIYECGERPIGRLQGLAYAEQGAPRIRGALCLSTHSGRRAGLRLA